MLLTHFSLGSWLVLKAWELEQFSTWLVITCLDITGLGLYKLVLIPQDLACINLSWYLRTWSEQSRLDGASRLCVLREPTLLTNSSISEFQLRYISPGPRTRRSTYRMHACPCMKYVLYVHNGCVRQGVSECMIGVIWRAGSASYYISKTLNRIGLRYNQAPTEWNPWLDWIGTSNQWQVIMAFHFKLKYGILEKIYA